MELKTGQRVTFVYEGREFDVVIIDPDGLGKDQPSVGFGFRMMEKYGGLPTNTLSQWLTEDSAFESDPNNALEALKTPSGKNYRVIRITGDDSNEYLVIEASDWMLLAADVLKKPGKVRKSTKNKLIDFITWFAVKGFYAEAYTSFKGVYTAKDSRATTRWLESRRAGVPLRNKYTDLLQEQGCMESHDYAYWTDYIYIGLFNMQAWQMRQRWALMSGDASIARNYIPEARGLEAVAFCEEMVVKIFAGDLEEAHDDAIRLTLRKYVIGGDSD